MSRISRSARLLVHPPIPQSTASRTSPTRLRTARVTARVWHVAFVALLGIVAVPAGAQQAPLLDYDHTTFVHGTGSGPEIWSSGTTDLDGLPPSLYLNKTVLIKAANYPNLDARLRWAGEVENLRKSLLDSAPGKHVLVTHSLGGLVARGAYLYGNANGFSSTGSDARPSIKGIVTVAATHQGTLLANNADGAEAFLKDVQRRTNDGIRSVKVEAIVLTVLVTRNLFAGVVVNQIFPRERFPDLGALTQLTKIPAIKDQMDTAEVIRALNSNVGDNVIPRANVVARIPARNAAIRLGMSFQHTDADFDSTVKSRNRAVSAMKGCKIIGYATIVMSGYARKCSYGVKVLNRVDGKWKAFVNGTYVRDVFHTKEPRDVAFDGVVSNERSQYPGLTDPFFNLPPVDMVNHQNVYRVKLGLNAVSDAMLRIGMQPTPAPFSATLTGASSFTSAGTLSWQVSAANGVTPFSYQWSYKPSSSSVWTALAATGATASRTVSSSTPTFTVRAVVTAANGESMAVSKLVTNNASTGCVPKPGGSSCPQSVPGTPVIQ